MDATVRLLITTALKHRFNEPNVEAGFARFSASIGGSMDYGAFCDAVAACLRQGLIREPIRLPEGALQCHWHLELTAAGVEATRQSPEVEQGLKISHAFCGAC